MNEKNRRSVRVLICSYLEQEYVETIRRNFPNVEVIYRPDLLASPRYPADHYSVINRTKEQEREWRELLSKAEVLFDFDHSHPNDLVDLAPNVKWVQATSAGIGQLVKRMGYAERTNWILTTASGVHSRPLAEFVIMSILLFTKNFFLMQELQEAHRWERYATVELVGKTLGIVGLGKIGRETARLAKMFDMNVVGIRRESNKDVPYVDKVYDNKDLHSMLKISDFLCLVCPHTPETENLIGSSEIAALPQGAVIINVARGPVLNEKALVEGLKTGHLGGASLDVFRTEPLPADSPLWSIPRVLISPHSASTSVRENEKLTNLFCENLKRYLDGSPLTNVFDKNRLY